MSLIKCPECGNEVSDKATKCPKCGYSIQLNIQREKILHLKGKALNAITENKIKCPSCGFLMDTNIAVCSECKKEIIKDDSLTEKTSIKKKYLLMLIIIIALILILCFFVPTDKAFSPYTKYLGKSYHELPSSLELNYDEGGLTSVGAPLEAGEIPFFDGDGYVQYVYADADLAEIYETEADTVWQVSWHTTSTPITDQNIGKLQKALQKAYGKYDKESEGYSIDDTPSTQYTWENKKGMRISLYIFEEDGQYTRASITWHEN